MQAEDEAPPKLILMSATAESTIYAKYFGSSQVNIVNIEGRMHDVEKIYLDDLSPELSRRLQPQITCEKRTNKWSDISQEQIKPGVTRTQLKAVAELISDLDRKEDAARMPRGAVLIFLPGVADINAMIRCFDGAQESKLNLIALHSKIPLDEQDRAFRRTPSGKRKVIVATNIAESSITVPDIRYVIDFCLTKNQVVDRDSGFASYQVEFCSRASCDQRAGRAGRVQNGIVYRLLMRKDYHALPEFSEPEILRSPVDITILKIKKFGLTKPKEVLDQFIDPPRREDVARAIVKLKEVQALQLEHKGKVDLDDGELTIMGAVMASLPLDVRLSKLILMGFAFGCFEECVKMAACMSVDDLLIPSRDPMERYKNRLRWASDHYSDALLLMNAFDEYLRHKESYGPTNSDLRIVRKFAEFNKLELRRLIEASYLYEELKMRLSRIGFSKPDGPNRKQRDPKLQAFLIKVALCGAFYPHYYVQKDIDFDRIRESVGQNNPLTTMVIRNMPPNGPLYCQAIRAELQECLCDELEFKFKGSDTFLLFKTDNIAQVPLSAYLCQKYYTIHKKIELPRISPEQAKHLLEQIERNEDGSAELKDGIKVVTVAQEVHDQLLKLRKAPLPSQAHFRASISWWNEQNAFQLYIHLDERKSQLNNLEREIENQFPRGTLPKSIEPKVGMIVFALYKGSLCRAQITTALLNAITVFFIDYGNSLIVKEVYAIPLSMVLCTNEAPFAYEAQLAKVQSYDGKPVKPIPFQKLQLNKPCRVELYSVVDHVLRVDIFVELNDEEIHINDKLRYDRIAILLDEPTISTESHKLDVNTENGLESINLDHYSVRGEVYLDQNEYHLDTEVIGAPFSPLAKNCCLDTLKRSHHVKDIYIVEQSVNKVMFGDTGVQRRFVVAHSERLSVDKQVQLLRTTLMPKLNMMLPFVALVFSPRAEYRCNDDSTAYIGAICGLGGQDNENGVIESVCPESDVEVPFSHELTRNDVKIINRIRTLLNEAFCGNNRMLEWTSVPILRIQDKLIQEITKFFNNSNRQSLTPAENRNKLQHRFQWSKAFKKYDAKDQSNLRQALFRPHCTTPIRTKQMFKLLTQMYDFMEAAKGVNQMQIMMCPICIKVFGNRHDARLHMEESEHRAKYARLKGESDDEKDVE
ncbi:putative ATP-dependent RNA helicase spindle-E-like [Tropilaelaps mercedesae]|uniref:Probable ATP-dependent RNA helicase spindle-E n=1 Tax=Tropilaelaps mercedesae TaxID=418985 RepID=A0A1V9X157_9ACAR|nr:putative ATP-dependent RNA helicase spindle-E-like [Tropilaelaps mercedesae]